MIRELLEKHPSTDLEDTEDRILCGIIGLDGAGGFVFDLIVVAYCFYAVSAICKYLVQSLQVICEKLNLSPDVAGATFMAAGTSAPELFTALLDTFVTKNDVGTGCVVGSVIFNIFCMIGGSSLIAPRILNIDWKPFSRDMFFYALTIVLFGVVVEDSVVHWWESIMFLGLYACYIVYMKYNSDINQWLDQFTPFMQYISGNSPKPAGGFASPQLRPQPFDISLKTHLEGEELKSTSTIDLDEEVPEEESPSRMVELEIAEPKQPIIKQEGPSSAFSVLEEVSKPFDWPIKTIDKAIHVLVFPITFSFYLTVPDLNKWDKKFWPATFTMAILWIVGWIYLMIDMATSMGCIVGIKPIVIGLTVLAIGTSFPDFMGSLYSARKGQGDMAVSNTLGSNIFDVLIGLGIPWIAKSIITSGKPVILKENDLIDQIVTMVISWAITLGIMWKLKLTKKRGFLLISWYIFYLVFLILHTYQVIKF